MSDTRVKIQSIVENQLPDFIVEESPLFVEFLKQYYISQEYPSAASDLVQNLDKYVKLDEIFSSVSQAILSADVSFTDTTIEVSTSTNREGEIQTGTKGFPDRYGIIKINDEIITYTSKTERTFEGCTRGFSGVTSYSQTANPEELVFSTSNAAQHKVQLYQGAPIGPIVYNLSGLFLDQFLIKLKKQFVPGFDERTLDTDLKEELFIKQAKNFYSSKGTDRSFEILFGALYGKTVEVVKPRDYLFRPSDAGWRRTKDLVVEKIEGNPLELLNNTLYQDANEDYDITEAYASITDVEKISIGATEYFKLSFDADFNKDLILDGTVYGSFPVHPKTLVITPVGIGVTILDVDSTVGFAQSGELVADYGSTTGIITYSSKSVTQFFGVSNVTSGIGTAAEIRQNVNAYGYSGIGTTNPIKVRIGSVLDKVEIPADTRLFSPNDTAKIKTLGISSSTVKRDNWISNIANTYEIESFSLIDSSNWTYSVTTYNTHNFRVGDTAQVIEKNSTKTNTQIVEVTGSNKFSMKGQGELDFSTTYQIQRKLAKVVSTRYPYTTNDNANIQNTYTKNEVNEVAVASPSIPFYNDQLLNPYDRKVVLSGSYSGTQINLVSADTTSPDDHGFYTGDAVYYLPYVVTSTFVDQDGFTGISTSISKFPEMEEGLYYIKRINSTTVSLSKSRPDLYSGDFISVSGIVTSNVLQDYNFAKKFLQPQNIIREVKDPLNKSGNYETQPGKIGVLVNGVEVLNNKSSETVFSGPIQQINVAAEGSDYDIINPPSLDITDATGVGATGICAIKGSLKKIEIIDSGFDYLDTPFITITGGNGKNAAADVNMRAIDHSVSFNAASGTDAFDIGVVGVGNSDIIAFSTYHKFRDYERVIYQTNKQTAISGLTTDSSYYVSVQDALKIKLYPKPGDAVAGLNTITLTNYGAGLQQFKSSEKKDIISDIVVTNSGEGYANKERTSITSGINTALNTININSHGYLSGETLTYATTGTVISGLNTSTQYLVKKIDDDSFKLASVGIGSTLKTEYLDSDRFIDLDSVGSGVHSFNYPSISVVVTGNIGVSTLSGQDFTAQIQPIFRGGVNSVHLTDTGSQYGSDAIINYDRQPLFTFRSGQEAEALVIVQDGSIVEVLVTRGGNGYNSPPNITINGTGNFAQLTPIIENGEITKINVLKGGKGYGDSTTLTIEGSGKNARLDASIQKWTVNLFEKYINTFTADDGIITKSARENHGLEYTHLYAPRKLRETVYVRNIAGDIQYGVPDLRMSNNKEATSEYHSPILGWAYDGNPIYGPYGYTTPEGGTPRAMESGYKSVSKPNRPPLTNFPQGFFNEDFEFKNNGDLDECNGRYAVTPEYPNGVYAYYSCINNGQTNTDGAFENYFEPQFPYFIGTCFYSQPQAFNFKKESNQFDYDLEKNKWFRNTLDYKFRGSNSKYDFVFDPNKLREQTVNITDTTTGKVTSVGIVTGGNNYEINDRLLFDNSTTGGKNAAATVEKIYGRDIDAISVATTSFSSVEFGTLDGRGSVIGFTTAPHGLKDSEIMNLSGFNTTFAHLQDSYIIGIRSDSFVTTLGIGSTNVTGLTTYFYVSGVLEYPYIRENDILGIGKTERVKVLNIDRIGRRIRVQRAVDGTVGFAYSASEVLNEKPRKFRVNTGFKTDYSYSPNKEIYFQPNESVGIGTTTAFTNVGIGSTVVFSMPGLGATQVFVPSQQIYLPNHGLKSGEKIRYSNHGGTGIACWHSISGITSGTTFVLPEATDLYAAKFSNDFIGVSTVKVGMGTTGVFVGVGSTTTQGLPFFTDFGIGNYHSFATQRNKVISGEIGQNIVTVSTASTHGLELGDYVKVSAVPINTETITVKYNDYNRRATFRSFTWAAGDVNVSQNTITLENHGLSTGDKVIYTASSPSGGLTSEEMYYVVYYTKDKIRLCATSYDVNLNIPNHVLITSATAGTISLVNPRLSVYRNKIVKFDLGDSSLSSTVGLSSYAAFTLNFYKDPEYQYKFESTGSSINFEVEKSGLAGVDVNAYVRIILNDEIPDNFYYKLEPINVDSIADIKKEIIIDTKVSNYNEISLIESKYSGDHRVVGVASTSFVYNTQKYPEASSYAPSVADLYYTTKSLTAYGPIANIKVHNGGSDYLHVPGVTTVTSTYGKGAILDVETTNIGEIVSEEVEDIGFNYPSDFTLSPSLNLPEILTIEPLTSFSRIGISSAGKNYLVDPALVVLDGYTGKQVMDVELEYQIGKTQVRIVQNTYGMYNVQPTIIPIHNSNGVGINTITYSTTSPGIVTAGINTGFSDVFPISVGDKILVENVSVGVGSTAKGYNSNAYNYALFPVTAVDENLGGSTGSVTYDMSSVLDSGEYPGLFAPLSSLGRIIPEKDFPIFDIHLKVNDFMLDEEVVADSGSGIVESWNNKTETLKVSSYNDLVLGETVTGQSSRTKGVIKKKIDFESYIELGPYAQVNKGFIYDTGILNNNVQRLPDNDYYQYFSYALKSQVPYETWNEPVSSLDHTAGFLKFSDLQMISRPTNPTSSVFAEDSVTEVIVNMQGKGNLNCVYTFDLATEETTKIGSTLVSNEIIFQNRVLTDYNEAIGNRVLLIDNFSDSFSHKARSTRYSIVDVFDLDASRTKKYFTIVQDRRYLKERQVLVVSLLQDGINGYLNQYGRVETHPDLGSFDWNISGTEGQLLFYPIKYKVNDYNIAYVSHDLNSNVSGIGSTALGSVVHINSYHTEIAGGSPASAVTIVGIASTYRSSKVIVEIGADDGSYFEFDELNLIHDGTTVDMVEYGQLADNNLSPNGIGGMGPYY